MLTKKEIKKIKEQLPRGFTKLIAERTNLSESMVEKFFSGQKYSKNIHEAAISMALESKSESEELKLKTRAL